MRQLRRRRAFLFGILAVAGVAGWLLVAWGYGNQLQAPFVFDDHSTFLVNSHLRQVWPLRVAASAPDEAPVAGRPVVCLSLAVNYALTGPEPWGFRLGNLIIHLINAGLLAGVILQALRGPVLGGRYGRAAVWIAAAASLLWAVHPLQTESVTYLTQRTELLLATFYLGTLCAAARAWRPEVAASSAPGRRREVLIWSGLAVVLCLQGMLTKEACVTLPVMVVLFDRAFWATSWRHAFRCRWGLYAGLAATWLALAWIMSTGPRDRSVGFGLGMEWWQYAATQCWAWAHYVRQALWPDALCVDHGLWQATRPGEIVPGAILVTALVVWAAWGWWTRPALGFLPTWMIVILAPTSSIVPIVTEVVAERRMYLPLAAVTVGICVLAWEVAHAAVARGVSVRVCRIGIVCLLVAVTAGLIWRTHQRNQVYGSVESLWRDVVRQVPENARGHYNLALELERQGRVDEAREHYQAALRLRPEDADIWYAVGLIELRAARKAESARALRRALELDPGLAAARSLLSDLEGAD